MIIFKGYGLLIVLVDYFGGLALLSQLAPRIFKAEQQQYMLLLVFHVVITLINFFLFRRLNRKEIRHSVYNLRLETAVLILGGILLLPLLMMGKDIIY